MPTLLPSARFPGGSALLSARIRAGSSLISGTYSCNVPMAVARRMIEKLMTERSSVRRAPKEAEYLTRSISERPLKRHPGIVSNVDGGAMIAFRIGDGLDGHPRIHPAMH